MNKNVIKSLAKLAKMNVEDLTTKLKSEEETEFNLNLTAYTPDELATRIKNDPNYVSPEDKTTLIEGTRAAALEIWTKQTKRELGLEFEGKDPKKLIEVLQAKNKGGEQNEAWKTEKEQMIQAHKTALTESENKFNSLLQEKRGMELKSKLRKASEGKKLKMPIEDAIDLFSMRHNVEFDESGKVLVKKNGEVLKNITTFEPLPVEKVYNDFIIENKYEEPVQGRGGSNTQIGAKAKSLEEFNKQWEEEGKSFNGSEYAKAQMEFEKSQAQA